MKQLQNQPPLYIFWICCGFHHQILAFQEKNSNWQKQLIYPSQWFVSSCRLSRKNGFWTAWSQCAGSQIIFQQLACPRLSFRISSLQQCILLVPLFQSLCDLSSQTWKTLVFLTVFPCVYVCSGFLTNVQKIFLSRCRRKLVFCGLYNFRARLCAKNRMFYTSGYIPTCSCQIGLLLRVSLLS